MHEIFSLIPQTLSQQAQDPSAQDSEALEIIDYYNKMPLITSSHIFWSYPEAQRSQIFVKGADAILYNYSKMDKDDWNYIKKWFWKYLAAMYTSGLFGIYLNRNKNSVFNTKYRIERYHLGRMLKKNKSIVFVYYISAISSFHLLFHIQRVGLKLTLLDKYYAKKKEEL